MLADIPNYSQRISAGKRLEHKIIDALRAKGFQILDPTSEEDKYQKIDGWWIGKKGGKYSLQVKARESGDDIIFELVKDIDRKIPGRDLISQAILYLVANTSGLTRMYLTKPIKQKAEEILKKVEEDMLNNPYKVTWWDDNWQVKQQIDRASGQRKLMAYFNPNLFEAMGTWNLKLH